MDRRAFLKGGALLPLAAAPVAVAPEEVDHDHYGIVEAYEDGQWKRRLMDPRTGREWSIARGPEVRK